MSDFFVLEIGMFAQYKYAWYEAAEGATYSQESPSCPKCGRGVGTLRWLPPYEVVLKQPRRIGDFVAGAGGCDFLVSEKFIHLCHDEAITGIDTVLPIVVKRMGTTKTAKALTPPVLYGVYLEHSLTQLKYEHMGMVWQRPPEPDYCRLCGPGGGGGYGIWRSRSRVVVDEATWTGKDFFYAINGPGTVLLSEKAAHFIAKNNLTNATVIPSEQAKEGFG